MVTQTQLFEPDCLEVLEGRFGRRLDELPALDRYRLAQLAFENHPFLMTCFRRHGVQSPLMRPRLLRELDRIYGD